MSPRRRLGDAEPFPEAVARTLRAPETIQARLDAPTREKLSIYMEQNNMSVSQATRVLLALALKDEEESPEAEFRAAAFKEGLLLGVAKLSERVQESIKIAFSEMEQYR